MHVPHAPRLFLYWATGFPGSIEKLLAHNLIAPPGSHGSVYLPQVGVLAIAALVSIPGVACVAVAYLPPHPVVVTVL